MKSFQKYFMDEINEDEKYKVNYPEGVYISIKPTEITIKSIEKYIKRNLPENFDVVQDLHCTLIYSRKPHVDELQVKNNTALGTFKKFTTFGENNEILTIELNSGDLKELHEKLMNDYNFVYDYDEYRPHITLSYNCKNVNTASLPEVDFTFEFNEITVEPLDTEKYKDSDGEETFAGKYIKKDQETEKE